MASPIGGLSVLRLWARCSPSCSARLDLTHWRIWRCRGTFFLPPYFGYLLCACGSDHSCRRQCCTLLCRYLCCPLVLVRAPSSPLLWRFWLAFFYLKCRGCLWRLGLREYFLRTSPIVGWFSFHFPCQVVPNVCDALVWLRHGWSDLNFLHFSWVLCIEVHNKKNRTRVSPRK